MRDKLSNTSPLSGPEVVKICTTSTQGPFAKYGMKTDLPSTQVCCTNTSPKTVNIEHLVLEPLRHFETGVKVESNINFEAVPMVLSPGESAVVTISGFVPAKPGTYTSSFRVAPKEQPSLAINIEYQVAAHFAWGLLCMFFGLLIIGFINVLDNESGVKGALRQAHVTRQSANELLQLTPPPQSSAAQIDTINHEFDSAIAVLKKPREPSFVDHRSADADEHLKIAANLTDELHKALSESQSKAPLGSIELVELNQEWEGMKNIFSSLSNRYLVLVASGVSLDNRLFAFDAWAAHRLLKPVITYYTGEMNRLLNNLQLLYASGRKEDAAIQAVGVRRWLQSAADNVNTASRSLSFFEQQHANDIVTVQRILKRLEGDRITVERREAILKSIDNLGPSLSEPLNWQTRHKVSSIIQELRTESLRATRDGVLAAAESARAQEEREDSIASVQAVIDEGAMLKRGAEGKIANPNEKIAWMQRVVSVWRTRLATFPDPNPAAMVAELDGVQAAIESNDLNTVSNRMHQLFTQWATYSSDRAKSAISKTTAPFCLLVRDDILIQMEATQQTIRALEGNLNQQKWESELASISKNTHATPDLVEKMPIDCLGTLYSLSEQGGHLANEVSSALWTSLVLPDVTKNELATDLVTTLTPEALATLKSVVRPLRIEITTPQNERYEGRQIEFKILNLGPDWGEGDKVTIDFGDNKPIFMSGNDLRKNNLVGHAYTSVGNFDIAVVVADSQQKDVNHPTGKIYGEGRLPQVSISPSPISLARQLEDSFFNERFGLSLFVAGLIYFWRYYSTKVVFGTNAFDYAQAFILGFAVSLAINELPQKLSEFIK